MNNFNLDNLVRQNIKNLQPYSSARVEYAGDALIFLDANENSYGSPLDINYNRYPDPLQHELKATLSKIKGIPSQNIFIGNGSDEVIDLAYRIFCRPGADNVIICPPTYGMYKVSGGINDVHVREVYLTEEFHLDVPAILQSVDSNTRLLFICSPNNPTANNMNRMDIELLLNNFPGIVIIDEAYINYSRQKSFLQELTEYENLLVMQTLSKAWGLAALRLGLAFASEKIIGLFNKVKPPYNINKASQDLGIAALSNIEQVNRNIINTINERSNLQEQLLQFNFIQNIYLSDANFILVRLNDADKLYKHLSAKQIIVRNRSKEPLCKNCLRITVGTPPENEILIAALRNYKDHISA
jgi:histidinol-phosphate aminotransferase